MKINRYTLLFLTTILLFCSCGGVKRLQKGQQIVITPVHMDLKETAGMVNINYTLHLPRGYAHRKAKIVVAPRFNYLDHVQELSPVVLYGKNSWRTAIRAAWLEDISNDIPGQITYVIDKKTTSINIKDQVPFELWMTKAPLIAYTTATACGRTALIDRQVLATGVTYIPMGPGPVITREITQSVIYRKEIEARIFFSINSYDIDMAMRDNRESLDSIIHLVDSISNNPEMKIKQIIITGYASPDGIYEENEKLAQERAEMVKNTLISQLHIPANLIFTKSVAEDWNGLQKLIETSNIKNKSIILNLIEGEESDNQKSIALKHLPQFRYLADNLLPQLRRVKCEIFYTIQKDRTVVVPK